MPEGYFVPAGSDAALWRPPNVIERSDSAARRPYLGFLIGQGQRFTVPSPMLKPICLLFTGLFAAGNLFAQTEPNKSPAGPDAAKPPTIHDPAKPSTEQSPPPAVAQSPAATNTSTDAAAKPQVDKNPPPLDLKNMHPSIKPADDFYLYANGGWVKSNPIPPEFSRWASFNELAEKNNDALHEIAEKAAAVAPTTAKKSKIEKAAAADLQKVGDFYASGMKEKEVDAAHVKPLQDDFKRIDALKNSKDVLKEIAHFHTM